MTVLVLGSHCARRALQKWNSARQEMMPWGGWNWRYCENSGFLKYTCICQFMCLYICIDVSICMEKYIYMLIFPSFLLKIPRSKYNPEAARSTHLMPREWFLMFPTKTARDYSEKCLIWRLGQGGYKISLEHVVKPERKKFMQKIMEHITRTWETRLKAFPWTKSGPRGAPRYQVQW